MEDPEQRRLEFQRKVADFIQEHRASVGHFKEPGLAAFPGSGEGTVRIAEQLAFQQVPVQSGTVDGHKGTVLPGTGIVDPLGEHLLAGARFAVDHHGELRRGEIPGQFPGFGDARGIPQDVGQMVFGHQSFFVELHSDIPFRGLEGLDILEGGHHSFYLAIHQDGDPVGGNQAALELHHLADF